MLADIRYWEQQASQHGYAIPHFNVWNTEMLMGVMDAAEELRAPVIISFKTGFVQNTSFEDFSSMMVSVAKVQPFRLLPIGTTAGVWKLFKMPIPTV